MPIWCSYTAEKGKRRAVHQDKDQILDEVAKTTQRLKQIEAAISNDLWERQWRLNQKRDVYARLLESMSELELNVGVLSRLLKMQSTEHLKDELRNYGERVRHVGQDLQRALAVAKVYLRKSICPGARLRRSKIWRRNSENHRPSWTTCGYVRR